MTSPTFSIVMPVKNRVDTIEKAILSVLSQSYRNFEFIILDGGSTDGTVQVIERYAHELTYWHSRPDKSSADAANDGIKRAKGEFVALLMADDWYEPDILQQMALACAANPEAEMLTCGGKIVKQNPRIELQRFVDPNQLRLNLNNICFGVSAICCRFVKRSLYQRLGLFLAEDAMGKQFLTNDKEFLLRAYLAKVQDIFVPMLGYTYLAHAESFSFGNHRTVALKHCAEHMTIAKLFLQQSTLSFKQKLFFHFWYCDQSAHLFFHHVIARNFLSAYRVMLPAVRQYFLLWPPVLAIKAVKLCYKMIKRKQGLH